MRNQWSWRTKSRLKSIDNTVKISQVIGKKDDFGQPFYPSFTNTTVVLVSEDKKTFETTKATADGLGNITFLKRGLADDGTDTEVSAFKRAWMPGTLMYVTFGSEDYENKADVSSIPTKTSDLLNDCGFVDSTALAGYAQNCDLCCVAFTNQYCDLDGQPTASDIGALPDSTKYGASVDLSIDNSTYVITSQLKDQDGNNLGSACTIDLPLESVVVDGCYNCCTKEIELTLENSCKICFSVADLVSGLQSEITCSNKLSSDLVDDSCHTNKFVTGTEKSCISSAVQPGDLATYAKCCDIPTDNCQLGNGCGYTTCTGTLQACDIANLAQCCDIPSVSGFVQESSIACINGCCLTQGGDITIQGAGGDMEKCVYDPNSCNADAFDYCNMFNTPTIPTDNCQLANGCGYTTCTGTVTATDLACYAQCCDVPTNNNQLINGCGFTTCTGTVTSSDISGLVAESCIACINGCCLTCGGDICVGGGGGGTVMCECCYDPGDYQQDFLYFTY